MGVDFIRRSAKSFEKSWDRGKKELAAPSLFKNDPAMAARTYSANLAAGANPQPGREYLVRSVNSELHLYEGSSRIGSITNSPPSLIAAVQGDGCGVAIARVVRVHEFSGAADVAVA